MAPIGHFLAATADSQKTIGCLRQDYLHHLAHLGLGQSLVACSYMSYPVASQRARCAFLVRLTGRYDMALHIREQADNSTKNHDDRSQLIAVSAPILESEKPGEER